MAAPDDSTPTRDAGEFGAWLRAMTAMLRGGGGIEVPCGDCVGCCSASWPVALRGEETALLAEVPHWLHLEVEDAPPGVRYMGYRDDGRCPLLADGRCTVYARRPATCRDFDCRLFAAAGIESAGPGKGLIDARIRSWRFHYADAAARRRHEAIRRTAAFLTGPARRVPGHRLPDSPVALAGIALKGHGAYLEDGIDALEAPDRLARVIAAARAFDR